MHNDQNIKQVLIIRKDLKMIRGKEIAQGSHGSNGFFADVVLESIRQNVPVALSQEELLWVKGSQTIVCLSANSEQDLLDLSQRAKESGLKHTLILDEGRTQFGGVPTYTVLSIGPDLIERINPITGHLKLHVDSRGDKKTPEAPSPVKDKESIYIPAKAERSSNLLSVFIIETSAVYFEAVLSRRLKCLIYPNPEVPYSVGDTIRLREVSPGLNIPTNRELDVTVTHLLPIEAKKNLNLDENLAVLSISPIKSSDKQPFPKAGN